MSPEQAMTYYRASASRSNPDLVFYHYFRYQVEGRQYEAKSGYGHAMHMGKGAEIPIRYAPEHHELAEMINPQTSELYRAWMNALWGLVFPRVTI